VLPELAPRGGGGSVGHDGLQAKRNGPRGMGYRRAVQVVGDEERAELEIHFADG